LDDAPPEPAAALLPPDPTIGMLAVPPLPELALPPLPVCGTPGVLAAPPVPAASEPFDDVSFAAQPSVACSANANANANANAHTEPRPWLPATHVTAGQSSDGRRGREGPKAGTVTVAATE
jgi:hypothetical protein